MWTWWNSLENISIVNWIARLSALILGIIIFIVGGRESALSKRARAKEKQEAELKVASLNVKAASLEVDAENARKEIAVAQAQAAQANEKAEAERLRRRQLEVSFEPRALAIEGAANGDLRLFPNTKVIISCAGADDEIKSFRVKLANVLESAGWDVTRGDIQPIAHTAGSGVLILSHKPDTEVPSKYNDAAQILQYILNDNGIEAIAFAYRSVPDGTIQVTIGAKPPRYFESRQLQEWIDQSGPTSIDPNSQEARSRSMMKKLSDPEENRKYHLRYDPKERDRIVKKYSATQ